MGKFIHLISFFKKAVAHWDVLTAAFRHSVYQSFRNLSKLLKKLQQFTEGNKSFSQQNQSHSSSIHNCFFVKLMYRILQKEPESLL